MATTTPNTSATTGDDIARAFLRTIGAPDTPLLRKAVIAWIRAESGNAVRAGNPWNITYGAAQEIAAKGGPKPIGSWTSQSSGLKFAVYPSSIVGAQASGRLLLGAGHDWRGYDKIIDAARRNDPIGFLNALARSAWDGGRYGTKNGGPNKLLGIYQSIGGDTSGISFGTRGGGSFDAPSIPRLTDPAQWVKMLQGAGISVDPTHQFTDAEARKIADLLAPYTDAQGKANLVPNLVGKNVYSSFPIAARLVNDFIDKGGAQPVSGAPIDPLAAIGDLARAILDPGNWVRILALLVGGAFMAYGGTVVLRAAGAPAPSLPSAPGVRVSVGA